MLPNIFSVLQLDYKKNEHKKLFAIFSWNIWTECEYYSEY